MFTMARQFFLLTVVLLAVAYLIDWSSFDPDSIRGLRVLITGASSGIGEQLAYQYSKLGASVVLVARREKLLQEVAATCQELGAKRVDYVVADMARSDDRETVVREAEKRLGGLDHLILNHAVIFAPDFWLGTPENVTMLEKQLQVNYVSFVDVASRALPLLMASKGRIGVVSSMSGKLPVAFLAAYGASKFAVQGFFTAYREELKLRQTGVSVTLCVLGRINTDIQVRVTQEAFPTSPSHLKMASADDTAMAIIQAVTQGTTELYYPLYHAPVVYLHRFFPVLMEQFAASILFQWRNTPPQFN